MKYLSKIFFLLLLVQPLTAQAQLTDLDWVIKLAEEIIEETSLCEECTWVNPTLSEVGFGNETYIFLRYSCSTQESFARMYNLDGTLTWLLLLLL